MLISIFTPTYNRAHTLGAVYKSLIAQTCTNFEWIIVDDGSIDNTKELVAGWQKENPFPIFYIYQQNGGKHTAINTGVKVAKGELFLIADSDDTFTPNTVEFFSSRWAAIPENKKDTIGGIWCTCVDENKKLVGSNFPTDPYFVNYGDFIYNYKNEGEKWHIERTDLMRQFPFPAVKISYFPESLVWKKIYKDHLMLCTNEPLRIYHQTPGSIMNSGAKWDGVLAESTSVLNDDAAYFFKAPIFFIKKCLLFSVAANMHGLSYKDAVKTIHPFGFKFIVASSYIFAYFYTRLKKS